MVCVTPLNYCGNITNRICLKCSTIFGYQWKILKVSKKISYENKMFIIVATGLSSPVAINFIWNWNKFGICLHQQTLTLANRRWKSQWTFEYPKWNDASNQKNKKHFITRQCRLGLRNSILWIYQSKIITQFCAFQ